MIPWIWPGRKAVSYTHLDVYKRQIKTMAAANKRLTGVKPSVYGFLNHVEQWDVSRSVSYTHLVSGGVLPLL